MTHALAVAFLVLWLTQLLAASAVKGSHEAARVWLRVGQVAGFVAVALSILTVA